MTNIIYMLVSVIILCIGFYLGRLTQQLQKQSNDHTHNTHTVKKVYSDIDGIMKPDRDVDDDNDDNIFFK